jgi:hypothetical protein
MKWMKVYLDWPTNGLSIAQQQSMLLTMATTNQCLEFAGPHDDVAAG